VEDLQELARQIRRWCDDNRAVLTASDPDVPAELFNRDADNWRPLIAIADATGWGAEVRKIAIQAAGQDADDARGIMLLADIRAAFETLKTDRLLSEDLVKFLVGLEGRPWVDCRRGEPITKHWLFRALAPFGVAPEPEPFKSPNGDRGRGYFLTRFDDTFARYLPQRAVMS
jgi:hypothetical protein